MSDKNDKKQSHGEDKEYFEKGKMPCNEYLPPRPIPTDEKPQQDRDKPKKDR